MLLILIWQFKFLAHDDTPRGQLPLTQPMTVRVFVCEKLYRRPLSVLDVFSPSPKFKTHTLSKYIIRTTLQELIVVLII